jgi:hypothetical protein
LDPIAQEAVAGLATVVGSLLPLSPAPALQATAAVIPERVAPTGLGGYVGPHVEPIGDVLGRRVHARLVVTVRAGTLADLGPAVQGVSTALLGAGSASLRGQGILRLGLTDVGPASLTGQGANQVASRDLAFATLYEYLRLPETSEGLIEEVPTAIDVASTSRGGRLLLDGAFGPHALGAFEVVDDPEANQGGPSQWRYDPTERRIEQVSNIRGGSFEITPNKPGTYLVLRPTAGVPLLSDFVAATELASDDVDALGMVFRWRDVDNFYFLLLDARRGYRMIARKLGGAFEPLAPPAVVELPGFVPGQTHAVRLSVQGSSFRVHVDGGVVLQAQDAALADAGRVGFMCRANDSARFSRLTLIAL